MPRRLTGSGLIFNTPYTDFRMTRPGTFWGGPCTNTNAGRDISRRLTGLEYPKPFTPTEGIYSVNPEKGETWSVEE
jgi:hypothetical protein